MSRREVGAMLLGAGTGLLLTAPAFVLSIMSAGGGHGGYGFMRAL